MHQVPYGLGGTPSYLLSFWECKSRFPLQIIGFESKPLEKRKANQGTGSGVQPAKWINPLEDGHVPRAQRQVPDLNVGKPGNFHEASRRYGALWTILRLRRSTYSIKTLVAGERREGSGSQEVLRRTFALLRKMLLRWLLGRELLHDARSCTGEGYPVPVATSDL